MSVSQPDRRLLRPPNEEWEASLSRFPVARPELVVDRELRCRTDSKFVLPRSAALQLLPALVDQFAVLLAGAARLASYQTLYCDTERLDCFHAHRRGRRVRHKVRIRHYPDRHLTLLEVKTRRTEIQTTKAWRLRQFGDNTLGPADRAFVSDRTGIAGRVEPQVWTNFRRVTLLGMETIDRVTIDLDLQVTAGHYSRSLAGIAIVEVKQWPLNRSTPVMTALRAAGFRPRSISKYCAAIALTHPDVRHNRLLPGIRSLERGAA